MIPLVDGNENVALLHPVLRARVAALCADPRVRGQLRVESAVRTYAEQVYLYGGWQKKLQGVPGYEHFNLAANPDRAITPAYGLPRARGSWHMEQPDGWGYAVDFNFSALPHDVQAVLEDVAREYRLIRTVPSEPWHYQMTWNDWTWLPEEADMPLTDDDVQRIADALAKVNRIQFGPGSQTRTLLERIDGTTKEILRLLKLLKPGGVVASLRQIKTKLGIDG